MKSCFLNGSKWPANLLTATQVLDASEMWYIFNPSATHEDISLMASFSKLVIWDTSRLAHSKTNSSRPFFQWLLYAADYKSAQHRGHDAVSISP